MIWGLSKSRKQWFLFRKWICPAADTYMSNTKCRSSKYSLTLCGRGNLCTTFGWFIEHKSKTLQRQNNNLIAHWKAAYPIPPQLLMSLEEINLSEQTIPIITIHILNKQKIIWVLGLYIIWINTAIAQLSKTPVTYHLLVSVLML